MNGQTLPPPPAFADPAKRVITFSYDDQGTILDTSIDGGESAVNDGLKQFLQGAFATVTPMTLSVGESVTIPAAISLPIPTGAANPMNLNSETRDTLTSVTFDGADRIAHLTVHSAATMSHEPAAGEQPAIAMDMKTTGDGKTDVNVDRGLVLHMELHSTMETSMQAPTPALSMRMHGAVNMVSDLVK